MVEENKKIWRKSTKWLDALVFIILPILSVIGSIRILRTITGGSLTGLGWVFFLTELMFVVLFIATSYYAYKRTKEGYVLIYILVILSGIQAAVLFGIEQSYERDPNFFVAFGGYLIACYLLWYYPNQSYFKVRKELFTNEGNCKFLRRMYKD